MTYLNPGSFLRPGYNAYIDTAKNDYGTQMDVGLLILEPGDSFRFHEEDKEIAILLWSGSVTFAWGGRSEEAVRPDCFHYEAYCLHAGCGEEITLTAREHSEAYIQKTVNETPFPAVFYTPETVQTQHAGANGELLGCMRREIKTFFDYDNAPYSNMVLGEVLNFPGKWSSYPPHHHPQPEVYFYRFDHPDGFGAGFANDEIYRTGHNGLAIINRGFHSQTAAPGYAMCYAWGIRHLEGDPWKKTRIDDPEHAWLWKKDANDHIFQG